MYQEGDNRIDDIETAHLVGNVTNISKEEISAFAEQHAVELARVTLTNFFYATRNGFTREFTLKSFSNIPNAETFGDKRRFAGLSETFLSQTPEQYYQVLDAAVDAAEITSTIDRLMETGDAFDANALMQPVYIRMRLAGYAKQDMHV